MTENRIKFSRKGAVCIVLLIAAALFLMVILSGIGGGGRQKVETPEDAAAFLQELGWEVDTGAVTVQVTVLPREFDAMFNAYNQLQKEQGYDLTQQAGEEITVYLFPVTNYPNAQGDVIACVMTCKCRVVGGDIHSAQMDGFMHALK